MKPIHDETTLARMLRRSLPLFAVVALVGILLACTSDLPDGDQTVAPNPISITTAAIKPTVAARPADTPELVRSDKSRNDSPDATAEELGQLVSGNSAFAFDLYRTLAEGDGNLFYSPYSISLALAMTYAGARSETESQMADTLQFLLSQERLHTSFNSLDLELASMADAPGEEGDAFTLNLANAVWGQYDYEFLEPFLDVLAENYGAGVRPADFVGSRLKSRGSGSMTGSLNETEDKDQGPHSGGRHQTRPTRMVLTNAIYFNARWFHPFFKHLTSARLFHLLDGSEVDIPMMMMAKLQNGSAMPTGMDTRLWNCRTGDGTCG